MFEKMDKNSNGTLEKDEIPGPMQAGFDQADKDGDGSLSQAEFGAVVAKMGGGGRPGSRDAGSRGQP